VNIFQRLWALVSPQPKTPAETFASDAQVAEFTLNEKQQKTAKVLDNASRSGQEFGDWYRGALSALERGGPDYLSQAANSIREIAEKLADGLGVDEYEAPTSKIVKASRELIIARKNSHDSSEALLRAADNLVELEPLLDAPRRTERFGLGLTTKNKTERSAVPRIQQLRRQDFQNLQVYFQNVTHHKRPTTKEEFLQKLALFESLILNYLSPVTPEQQKRIKAILVNDPSESTKAEVDTLIKHSPSNEKFLLRSISSPTWINYLQSRGFLENLPTPEETTDSGILHPHSEVVSTLIRLAPLAPEQIIDILESLPVTENHSVQDQITRCHIALNSMPLVGRSLKHIAPIIRNTHLPYVVVDIAKSWMSLGAYDECIALLGHYVSQRIDNPPNYGHHSATWEIEQLNQIVILPMIQIHPKQTAKKLYHLLKYFLEKSAKEYRDISESMDYPSVYWLRNLKGKPDGYHLLETILAIRLFQALTELASGKEIEALSEFNSLLRKNPWDVFNRIRLQIYADFPELFLKNARDEALLQIPNIHLTESIHRHEFSNLLRSHSEAHGSSFLSKEEISRFFDLALIGPVNTKGILDSDTAYIRRFRIEQLFPIKKLLNEEQYTAYTKLVESNNGKEPQLLEAHNYREFRSGSIISISPSSSEELAKLEDKELWESLNTWKPSNTYLDSGDDYEKECILSLAKEFAKLLHQYPERFLPETSWWSNIDQPEILSVSLEEIQKDLPDEKSPEGRYSNLSDGDWITLFGISEKIIDLGTYNAKELINNRVTGEDLPRDEWNYPRVVVARFLQAATHSKFQLEDRILDTIQSLSLKNLAGIDFNLDGKKIAFYDDWQGKAINSFRGTTVDGLIRFAWHAKNNKRPLEKYSWVPDTIRELLSNPDESPAVFAILGTNLRLLVYIFGDQIGAIADLLLPGDKPESRNALIISHTLYDQPMKGVLTQLPNLPDHTLNLLKEAHALEAKPNDFSDFANRVGLDILFYYWNSMFKNEGIAQKLIDRFFEVATSDERAATIRQVARAFSKTEYNDENHEMLTKVMSLWEHRYSQLIQQVETGTLQSDHADEELNAFLDWLGCDCFPFDWRVKYAELALGQLSSDLQAYTATDNLTKIAKDPAKLQISLRLLKLMVGKSSGHNSLWQFETEDVIAMVKDGLQSGEVDTVTAAEEAQDALLRKELFRFMDL
jgi:hypothetical protein